MGHRHAVSSLIFAAIVSLAAESLTPEDTARLERGEVLITADAVPGRSVPHVRAIAVIKAPPERVWAILDDCAHYKDNLPRILESEEVLRDGTRVRCREKIGMPFPFSDLRMENDAVNTIEPGRRYVRAWHLREGDFRVNQGSWTLEARDGGKSTLATYETLSEPTTPLPSFIVKLAQQ